MAIIGRQCMGLCLYSTHKKGKHQAYPLIYSRVFRSFSHVIRELLQVKTTRIFLADLFNFLIKDKHAKL